MQFNIVIAFILCLGLRIRLATPVKRFALSAQ